MAKNIYIGGNITIPGGEIITTHNITADNIEDYFTIGGVWYYSFVGSGSTFTSNNKGYKSSTADTTLTAKVAMSNFKLSYGVSSESGYDKFTFTAKGTTVANGISGEKEVSNYSVGDLAVGDVLSFEYTKDSSGNNGRDIAWFKDMSFTTSTTAEPVEKPNVALPAKTIYVGVNGIARRAKKAYIGVNGVARIFWDKSFDWGDETVIGDANWWAGLKDWVLSSTAAERAACVGKKKLVSLSTAVLGANAATMICIGADQDGVGTLTFQTAGVLPTTTTFSPAADQWNVLWIGSKARTECQNFYNYCSAKTSIKTVKKGTCNSANKSRAGTAVYNDETVWIPSEREMGGNEYAAISVSNSTTTNAECCYGYNEAYSYYTNNSRRIKYAMNASGILTTTAKRYWERSRYYYDGNGKRSCEVRDTGQCNWYYPNENHYLAPAFVIG